MSRSPEKRNHDSEMRSVSPSRSPSRSREQDEAPPKRMRTDARKEDKARGKRLFGNILGTLQKFQKDDKTSRTSEAAKRREQVSSRIAEKLRSETTLHNDIAEAEKELKSLRIGMESAEYVLRHKEVAMEARHSALKPTSRFLYTSSPLPTPLIFETNLLHPSPIPLVKGPGREPPRGKAQPPLYFLPKILLPHQKEALHSRKANIAELISEEEADLVKERDNVSSTVEKNKARIAELQEKLVELRRRKKESAANDPESSASKRDTDELGRTPRDEMDLDGVAGTAAGRTSSVSASQTPVRDSVDGPATASVAEAEASGVLIKGDEGDIEVEY
ncbi:hypothetical protein IAU60_004627 [Kwoniella sp. DSM 27419]